MICFGAKTDQEVKEKGHVDPTLKKKKQKNKTKTEGGKRGREEQGRLVLFFFIFIFSRFSLRYTEIGPSEFVASLYSTRATHGNQKYGI